MGKFPSGHFINQLVKVDIHNRTAHIWHSSECYLCEPIFVAASNAIFEDEGVILSVVLNVRTQNSFLLMLDAQSWNELARVQLPYHLPCDFHGQYFGKIASTQRIQLHR